MICNDFDVFLSILSIIGHFFSERVESSDPIGGERVWGRPGESPAGRLEASGRTFCGTVLCGIREAGSANVRAAVRCCCGARP